MNPRHYPAVIGWALVAVSAVWHPWALLALAAVLAAVAPVRAVLQGAKGLEPGDEVGQDGVEYTYDRFLRGRPGLTRVQVDAFGQPTQRQRPFSKRLPPGG